MSGLRFQIRQRIAPSAPRRADIACFVGFAARRGSGPLPAALRDWLTVAGWLDAPTARPGAEDLRDVPVPVDSWEDFQQLFLWERRGNDPRVGSYLGAAVRSFFAQGGARCYVVAVAEAPPHDAPMATRQALLEQLLPGYPGVLSPSPVDPASWRGIGHLCGLPDVAMLCVPDLAELLGVENLPPPLAPPPSTPPPEVFVDCVPTPPSPPADEAVAALAAPRCDAAGYGQWARILGALADWLGRFRREVQVLAAVPLPTAGIDNPLALAETANLDSRFLQLVYPWVRGDDPAPLPAGLESPEGLLAGVLARSILARGAFRSAAGSGLRGVQALEPALGEAQQAVLVRRVSLLGATPTGLRLLGDITTSSDPTHHPAPVVRLLGVLLREARRLGETAVFETSGERLWGRLRNRLESLLLALYGAGALRGASPAEAFQVRCDRSTMSQNDIDNGRVVARVVFAPALPIEQITVVLSLASDGAVSLLDPGREAA